MLDCRNDSTVLLEVTWNRVFKEQKYIHVFWTKTPGITMGASFVCSPIEIADAISGNYYMQLIIFLMCA